jgi:hypothetical protein
MSDVDSINIAATREIYRLLDELDGHIDRQDASGKALLYQAKEHVRLLIISIDRSSPQVNVRVAAEQGRS